MTGITSLFASNILNDQDVWNKRLDSLENYLKRINADEEKNNHS